MFPINVSNRIITLALAALFLLGMGRVLTLPPFDGMDETAHYSRIEAAAFAKPDAKIMFISAAVVEYYKYGPMPRGWIVAQAFNLAYNEALETGKPARLTDKLKEQGFRNYRQFFAEAAREKDKETYLHMYRRTSGTDTYVPSADENWQYQHPPLYYLLMGSVLRVIGDMPLVERLLVLRAFSFSMAFAGFCIGLYATLRHFEIKGQRQARDIMSLAVFYPFVMPVWFAEFARIGNDSLCLLMFSLIWALMLWHRRRPEEKAIWILAGVVMGYACLVKFFMLPMTVGFLLYMALRPLSENAPKDFIHRLWLRLLPPLVAGFSAFVIGGGPYLKTSGALGSLEITAWRHGRGFLKPEEGIPYEKIFWNLQNMLSSMISHFANIAVPQIEAFVMLIFFMLAAVLCAWLSGLPRDPKKDEWLPLFPLLPMLGGLALHAVFAAVAYRAAGVTPGGYIHVEAPALALIFGAGLLRCTSRRPGRILAVILLAASVCASAGVIGMGLGISSGCLWLSENIHQLNADGQGGCAPEVIYDHLALLAWPAWGLLAFALGLSLLVFAVAKTSRAVMAAHRRAETDL